MTETQIPAATPAHQRPTDAELAARARDGDGDAFGALYERHASRVYNFLIDLVQDETDAEDLMQTTFLRALRGIGKLRDTELVSTWLFSIAYNCARHHKGGRYTESLDALVEERGVEPAVQGHGPEDTAVSRDMAARVWTAARSLDARQFTILDLNLRHGMGSTEIAGVIGTTPAHTSVLLHRAREAFGVAFRVDTVARLQTVCPRLRELVPVGETGPLTPSQRRSVEHHMRSCDECRSLADRMTAPAELLSGLVFLPLPAALAKPHWLHGAARAARPSLWDRGMRRIGRGGRFPLAALGVAGVVATAGIAGGIAAVTHRTVTPLTGASATAPRSTSPSSAAAPTTAPTATPTPGAQDESGKSADAAWADMASTVRAAQSYHIAFTTTSLSDEVTQFDVHFARSGDYAGTATLALAGPNAFGVRKVNGTLYAQGGAAIQHQPDIFGLTPDQAAQLGTGWLQLTGDQARSDTATIIDRTLSMWADPHQLADTLLQPDGAVHFDGTDSANGEQLVVLRDDTGTMSVTRFGAEPRRASNGIDTVTFSDFNVPVTVAAPSGALVLS